MNNWWDDEISRLNNVIRTLEEMLKEAGVHPAIINSVMAEAYNKPLSH